jgi:hypothetical protein
MAVFCILSLSPFSAFLFVCCICNTISTGQYRLMDGVALTILQRERLRANIIKGTRENYLAALRGEPVGTVVGDE